MHFVTEIETSQCQLIYAIFSYNQRYTCVILDSTMISYIAMIFISYLIESFLWNKKNNDSVKTKLET